MSCSDILLVVIYEVYMTHNPNILENLPLTESTFFIMLCLSPGPLHGYAIMKDVERISNQRLKLSTGTLYGVLKRLLNKGWIERIENTSDQGSTTAHARPRKSYALTDLGRSVLNAEAQRLNTLVQLVKLRISGAQS